MACNKSHSASDERKVLLTNLVIMKTVVNECDKLLLVRTTLETFHKIEMN